MQATDQRCTPLEFALQAVNHTNWKASTTWILWFALAFITGTGLGLNGIIFVDRYTLFVLACALTLELASQHFFTTHIPFLTFVLALFFTFALGVERSGQISSYNNLRVPSQREIKAVVVLTGSATSTNSGDWYPAKLLATFENNLATSYNILGRLLLRKGDSLRSRLRYGSQLYGNIDFAQPSGLNPHEFDLQAWQHRRGELFVGRILDGNVMHIVGIDSTIAPPLLSSLRERIIERFIQAGVRDRALELVKAMSIGERQELPRTVRENFSRSGIAHLLALSGLHVGFLYALFAFLGHLIGQDRLYKRFLRELFPLLTTWGFVLLAGASASLLRAAIMLSVWGLSRIFLLHWQPIDVLALCAIILLWVSPAALYALSFQLSFTALLGIVLLYPHIKPYTHTRYKPITLCLQLLAVSLCAQLGTLPITLYTFGTLPLLSLFTNIIAIPLAMLIVPLALIVGFMPTDNILTLSGGFVLQHCADFLLWITEHISRLPDATLTGVRIPLYIAWVLAVIFIFAGIFLSIRRRWVIIVLLIMIPVSIGAVFVEIAQTARSREIVVYQQAYGTALSLRSGRQIEGIYIQNYADAKRHISQYASGVWGAQIHISSVEDSPKLHKTEYGYEFATGLRIAIPVGRSPQKATSVPHPIDVLLLTHDCKWNPKELISYFTPHEVVIDGSYPRRCLQTTMQGLKQQGIQVHCTRTAGAWVWKAAK